jgi:hypothetical protein
VLLALLLRLWFDLAQARVVRDNERKVFRTLLRSFKLAFTSGLYTRYLGIALFAAVTAALGLGIWFYLPHSAMGASFLVLELVTVTQIASRLWLKAASARWVALLPGPEAAPVLIPVMAAPLDELRAEVTPPEPPVSE